MTTQKLRIITDTQMERALMIGAPVHVNADETVKSVTRTRNGCRVETWFTDDGHEHVSLSKTGIFKITS